MKKAIHAFLIGLFFMLMLAASSCSSTPAEINETDGTVGKPPVIPHTLSGRDNCRLCHKEDGIPLPADHVGRTNEVCTSCHQLKK